MDFYPERAAWGAGVDRGAPGVESFIALTNDDTYGRFLRVYGLTSLNAVDAFNLTITVYQGTIGTKSMQGQPLVTNLGSAPGSIYTGRMASGEVGTPFQSGSLLIGVVAQFPAPLIVLANGWSLITWAGVVNSQIVSTFMWMFD